MVGGDDSVFAVSNVDTAVGSQRTQLPVLGSMAQGSLPLQGDFLAGPPLDLPQLVLDFPAVLDLLPVRASLLLVPDDGAFDVADLLGLLRLADGVAPRTGDQLGHLCVSFRLQAAVGVVVEGGADYRAIDGRRAIGRGATVSERRSRRLCWTLPMALVRWAVGGIGGEERRGRKLMAMHVDKQEREAQNFRGPCPCPWPCCGSHPRQPGRWQKCPCVHCPLSTVPSPKHSTGG